MDEETNKTHYRLMAYSGDQYGLQLAIATTEGQVRNDLNGLRTLVANAHPLDNGWLGALVYARSIGCLRMQIEQVCEGPGNQNVTVIDVEEWICPKYSKEIEQRFNNVVGDNNG